MKVSLSCNAGTAWRLPLAPAELEEALGLMWQAFNPVLTALFPAEAVLELALLDEAEMAELNFSCLGCVGPTNILAFPVELPGLPAAAVEQPAPANQAPQQASGPYGQLNDKAPSLPYLDELAPGAGLLALSPWTLRREARLYGQDLTAYTLRLLAHGLAHLLGYDHGEDMDKASGLAAQAAAQVFVQTAAQTSVQPGQAAFASAHSASSNRQGGHA